MKEHQRQSYLTSMGIESYMPRWRLIVAPAPIECVLPALQETTSLAAVETLVFPSQDRAPLKDVAPPADKPIAVAEMLRELQWEQPKRAMLTGTEPKIASPVSDSSLPTIPAFTLSIWRPQGDLLIIDSRNVQLALPTERLLQNILQALHGVPQVGHEDILRWPLVDNTFVSRTVDDVRSVLQVWLEVELERRPVKRILLMGENATQYFLESSETYSSLLLSMVELGQFSAQALISPSLVELLQQPVKKRSLWHALQPWRNGINRE